jgi:hypothetical protein
MLEGVPLARFYRVALIAEWVLALGAAAIGIATEPLLAPELRAYLDRQASAPLTAYDLIEMAVGLAFLGLAAATTVGLFRFKRWARRLFLVLTLFGFVPILAMGPTVETGAATALAEAATLLSGIILALIYWSPVRDRFEKKPI